MALTGWRARPGPSSSPHLAALTAEVERLAGLLAATDPPAGLRVQLRSEAALATLRLDGSRLTALPDVHTADPAGSAVADPTGAGDDEPATATAPPLPPTDDTTGSWLTAMRVGEDEPDERVAALEARGALAALDADDLAAGLLDDPLPSLRELHRRLVAGLVTADRAGAERSTEQAVHDASTGRVVYFTTEPAAVADELAALAGWLRDDGSRQHPLMTAGIAHVELLRIHPFDAANGRLARATARLLLRAGGLDPHGLGAPEAALAIDPLGYHEEVASTLRRRDATIWLERWAEAVADGLCDAARRAGALDARAPGRAAAFVAAWDAGTFTLADYRDGAGVDAVEARDDLGALLDAGTVRRVPGSRGLRFLTAG